MSHHLKKLDNTYQLSYTAADHTQELEKGFGMQNVHLIYRNTDGNLTVRIAKFFTQGYSCLCFYKEPRPKKPRKDPHHQAQTPSTENPNPKNPAQAFNPKIPNHHK